jgi:hypothetical protein
MNRPPGRLPAARNVGAFALIAAAVAAILTAPPPFDIPLAGAALLAAGSCRLDQLRRLRRPSTALVVQRHHVLPFDYTLPRPVFTPAELDDIRGLSGSAPAPALCAPVRAALPVGERV